MIIKKCIKAVIVSIVVTGFVANAWSKSSVIPPPNEAAQVEWKEENGSLSLNYNGKLILSASVTAKNTDGRSINIAVKLDQSIKTGSNDDLDQILTFTPAEPGNGAKLFLSGTVTGSEEAFMAETDGPAQQRFPMVRNSVGTSRNLRNNAVYDRHWDWVLIGPTDGATAVALNSEEKDTKTFSFKSDGGSVTLNFRPRFYQKHKALVYYTPWTYKPWKGSLTGYCTWWPYRAGFNQEILDALMEVFVEKKLPDYGYEYMQFDNCYQIGNGSHPKNWLEWHEKKFPKGRDHAMKVIRDAGMTPGIWVHRVHRANDRYVQDTVNEHPDWFVTNDKGEHIRSSNCYLLNTHNKEAVEAMIRPLYRGLKEQGWPYVKIDGAGDLLKGLRDKEVTEFYKKYNSTPEETYRVWDEIAREELGRDVFMLTCWGVSPGVISASLTDGVRLGSDGFGTGLFHGYNSLNGVAFRNDPDHCDVLGEYAMDLDAMMPVFGLDDPVPARAVIRPALCSIAGGMLMVSDKVEVYKEDCNIEGMKRSAPVLYTLPGQLYDVSGRKPESFNFSLYGGEPTWWMLEIDRPFDHWSVLARFQWGQRVNKDFQYQGLSEQDVKFADLGLESDREYAVFEFWTQKFLGTFKGSFTAPAMDDNTGMNVFAIREVRKHPWVLSTTRHLSQGGVSLSDVRWDENKKTLSGMSAVVAKDSYVLTMHVPQGYKATGSMVDGNDIKIKQDGEIASVKLVPSATGNVNWSVKFKD